MAALFSRSRLRCSMRLTWLSCARQAKLTPAQQACREVPGTAGVALRSMAAGPGPHVRGQPPPAAPGTRPGAPHPLGAPRCTAVAHEAPDRQPQAPHVATRSSPAGTVTNAKSEARLDGEEDGPQLGQPLGVDGGHALHVLLDGEDQLVVDDVVGRVPQAVQGAAGVQVAGHAAAAVDILPDALHASGPARSSAGHCRALMAPVTPPVGPVAPGSLSSAACPSAWAGA